MHLSSIGAFKIMAIPRITSSFRFVACSVLICTAFVCDPRPAFAQTTDSSGELTQEAEPRYSMPRSSGQARENQQQSCAQGAAPDEGCSIHGIFHDTWAETLQFGHGLKSVPRSAVRPSNLKWELPILAATGEMIAKVDRPADNRIQSKSLQQTAGQWSNIGLGLELGSAALVYGIGCGEHHSYLRDTGFKALAAMGAAGTADLVLKLAFDRQFPYTPNSTGKFWGGGRSFPSGHSATSFAFAAVGRPHHPQKNMGNSGGQTCPTRVNRA